MASTGQPRACSSALSKRDVEEAEFRLMPAYPAAITIVLACTTMPVFQPAIEAATGCPTVDLEKLLTRAN